MVCACVCMNMCINMHVFRWFCKVNLQVSVKVKSAEVNSNKNMNDAFHNINPLQHVVSMLSWQFFFSLFFELTIYHLKVTRHEQVFMVK